LSVVPSVAVVTAVRELCFQGGSHCRGFRIQKRLEGFLLVLIERNLVVLKKGFKVFEHQEGIGNLGLVVVAAPSAIVAIAAEEGIDVASGKDDFILRERRKSQQYDCEQR